MLFVVCCLLYVVGCSLLDVCRLLLFVVRLLLFGVWSSLCLVCCVLFVWRLVLVVA